MALPSVTTVPPLALAGWQPDVSHVLSIDRGLPILLMLMSVSAATPPAYGLSEGR